MRFLPQKQLPQKSPPLLQFFIVLSQPLHLLYIPKQPLNNLLFKFPPVRIYLIGDIMVQVEYLALLLEVIIFDIYKVY